ncbi:hypothetical protein, partial [Pseudomonas amygdali]|uniref:hypothetical protein n=1 Tax=Pseudomonas amygdali TaxID=47877 RepID=UPI002892678D
FADDKSAICPGSFFNRQGGSVFNQRRQAALTEMYFVTLTVVGRAEAPFRLKGAELEPTYIYASGCVAHIAFDINDCLDFDSSDSFHCRYLNSPHTQFS